MGTEQFSYIRPSVAGNEDHIQLVSQAWGDEIQLLGRANSSSGDGAVQPAGLFSTAPYVPSKKSVQSTVRGGEQYRPVERMGYCTGKGDTCLNKNRIDFNGQCSGCRAATAKARIKAEQAET